MPDADLSLILKGSREVHTAYQIQIIYDGLNATQQTAAATLLAEYGINATNITATSAPLDDIERALQTMLATFMGTAATGSGPGVADLAALKAIIAGDRTDKDVRLVESVGLTYRFDADSIVDPTTDPDIEIPDDVTHPAPGRWYLVELDEADEILYVNTASWLTATHMQAAVDELAPVMHSPVADIAGLTAIVAASRADRMLAFVDDQNRLYSFDAADTTDPTTRTDMEIPDDVTHPAPGRWIRMAYHASEHENGGVDEISVAGLSGLLADDQNPVNHATDHQHGGSDEVATATPGANAIPKADASGLLDGWITQAWDAIVVGTNTAATDKTNIDAAISAVSAGSGDRKTILLMGRFALGANVFAAADYITFNAEQAYFRKTADNAGTIYFTGTEMVMLGGFVENAGSSSSGGFFGGHKWEGGFVLSWPAATLISTSQTYAQLSYRAQSGLPVSISGAGSQITANYVNGATAPTNSSWDVAASSGTITLSGDNVNYRNGGGGPAVVVSGSGSYWRGRASGGITVTGTYSHVEVPNGAATCSVTQSGQESFVDVRASTGAIALSGINITTRIQYTGSTVSSFTNTASDSDILVRMRYLGNAVNIALGTRNTYSLLVRDTAGGTADTLTLLSGTDCPEAKIQTVQPTVDIGGASLTGCSMTVMATAAGAAVTAKNGSVGNTIDIYCDTQPTVEADAALENTIRWYDTSARGILRMAWEKGRLYQTKEELIDFGGTGAKNTTIQVDANEWCEGVPLVIETIVAGTNPGAPTQVVPTWNAGGMTDPTPIAGVAVNTKSTADLFEQSAAAATLNLDPQTGGAASVVDATGKVRVRFTTIRNLAMPDE